MRVCKKKAEELSKENGKELVKLVQKTKKEKPFPKKVQSPKVPKQIVIIHTLQPFYLFMSLILTLGPYVVFVAFSLHLYYVSDATT